jgi:hypothetical protein
MYKVLIFNSRREGLSREEFRDYYESVHAKRAEPYLDHVKHYSRRYLDWIPDGANGTVPGFDFDVITEIWCDSREDFDAAMGVVFASPAAAGMREDEAHMFASASHVWATVTECESDLEVFRS